MTKVIRGEFNVLNMEKISAEQFFGAWVEAVQGRRENLLSVWRQATPFTSHVKGDDKSIMKEVADKLNLLCYHSDYYCIDTVLYKPEDLVPGRPQGSYWFRDIRVAFEHENNVYSGLYKEASHLLITNCDLRVLVTYPNGDGLKELNDLHNIIVNTRQSKIISDDKSFLVIFGSESDFLWEGFVYNTNNWEELTYV